jgi:hypothetical protein
MKKLVIFILSFVVLLSTTCFSGVTKTGTTAAPFLKVDVGSRAIGMGSAYVALAEDATAMYWNPGGLAGVNQNEVIFCHNRWIADITFNYAAIAVPVSGAANLGLSATFLTTDDMERTTINSPDGTGEMFSVGSYAFGLCYAMNLTDRFSIGLNLKYIYEYIYHCSAKGVAVDVGTMYDTNFKGIKVGMSIANYGTKMRMDGRDLDFQVDADQAVAGNNPNIDAKLKTDSFELPLLFRLGVATNVLQNNEMNDLTVSVDALHPNDDVEYVNVGAEYVYNNMFSLRGGYKTLFAKDSEEGLSLGAGLQYTVEGVATFQIDYAYHDFGILNEVQMFTLALKF